MDNLINSGLVQSLVKFAFSKSGVVIRWAVGYAIVGLAAQKIIPSGDLEAIQVNLTSGLTAVVAIAYAGLQYWINSRQKKGIEAVQELVGHDTSGVVGNGTVEAVANAVGADRKAVDRAIQNVENAK